MVYLIHFEIPIGNTDNLRGQAQHYLGSSDNLVQRLQDHRNGNGARIMEVVNAYGVKWWLARIWPGDRKMERKLKNQHNAPRLCPVCQALERRGR